MTLCARVSRVESQVRCQRSVTTARTAVCGDRVGVEGGGDGGVLVDVVVVTRGTAKG